jgi:hypothetical protein
MRDHVTEQQDGAPAAREFLAGELRWIHRLAPDLARAL